MTEQTKSLSYSMLKLAFEMKPWLPYQKRGLISFVETGDQGTCGQRRKNKPINFQGKHTLL